MTSSFGRERSAAPTTRVYGLDVIRGVAVALVMLRHAWPNVFGSAGVVGVTMFFALSGYLITGLLVRDIATFGRVRYRRFYLHRALRLFPALVFMLAGFAIVEGVWNVRGEREEIVRSVLVGLSYTMNVPGFDHGSEAISHLWTLATEEQFYIVWPLVLVFGFRFKKLGLITALSIVGVTVLCTVTIYVSPRVDSVYNLPTSWFATMMIGALACLFADKFSSLLPPVVRKPAAVTAMAFLVALTFMPDMKDWAGTYLIVGPAIAICTVVLVACSSLSGGGASPWMKPFLGLGTVSYAAYLWNLPISAWFGEAPLSVPMGTVTIGLTIVAATISWLLIERPMSQLRRSLDRRLQLSSTKWS